MTEPQPDWRSEFVALLSSGDEGDRNRALQLKRRYLPSGLYQYRRFTKRSFAALVKGTIWLSAADQFNDLYDTAVMVDLAQAARDLFSPSGELDEGDLAKQVGPDAAEQIRAASERFFSRHGAHMTTSLNKFTQRATKVACFCEAWDQKLLWAHYADSNRGYCVEYALKDLRDDDLQFRMLVPVVYTPRRFELKLGQKKNIFVAVLAAMHKAPEWAYEREWRIVVPIGDDAKGLEWSMPKPTRVLLGSRMAPDDRKQILSVSKNQGFPAYETAPSADGFRLVARLLQTE